VFITFYNLRDFLAVAHQSVTSEPPLLLELNCLVFGEPRANIFPVKISHTETIGSLKKVIKDENEHLFQHVDAKALVLCKTSIHVDDRLEITLGNLDHQPLSPVEALSEVFPTSPVRKHLHIVVKSPPAGEF
jgi:hypothetical protein